MKAFVRTLSIGLCVFVLMNMSVLASGQDLSAGSEGRQAEISGGYILLRAPITSPLFAGFPLALVSDEPVTLSEFNRSLGAIHGEMSEGTQQTAPIDYAEVLKRLINTRLAAAEARAIGIDEQPEIQKEIEVFSKRTLREFVLEQQTKDVVVDEAEVERLYKDRVKEFSIKAVLFKTMEDAEKMETAVKAGKDFDSEAKQMVANGRAEAFREEKNLRKGKMMPEIEKAVSGMSVGSVSPVIPVQKNFIIVKFEDVQDSESPEAREEARAEALAKKRFEVLKVYNKTLSDNYLKLDQKLFDSLDFEAEKPGFLNLMEDKRILVEVKGDKPVTVGEYTNAVKEAFFHDVEGSIKRKKVNKKKMEILQQLVTKRALLVDALAKGIDKTDEYKDAVRDYKDSVLFSAFINKVVAPDVSVSRDDVEAYYHEHQSEYSLPEQIKFESIFFGKRIDAEKAIEELRKGTDLKWIKENAEGRVDKEAAGIDEEMDDRLQDMSQLPESVRKVVSGVKPGDVRLYKTPSDNFCVLVIREVYPARPAPLEAVEKPIFNTVFNEKLMKQFEEWADKLWGAYNVKVFADDLAKKMKGDTP